MNTKMKPQVVAPRDPQEETIRGLYSGIPPPRRAPARRLLDVIKDEFDRQGRSDSMPSRLCAAVHIGNSELTGRRTSLPRLLSGLERSTT